MSKNKTKKKIDGRMMEMKRILHTQNVRFENTLEHTHTETLRASDGDYYIGPSSINYDRCCFELKFYIQWNSINFPKQFYTIGFENPFKPNRKASHYKAFAYGFNRFVCVSFVRFGSVSDYDSTVFMLENGFSFCGVNKNLNEVKVSIQIWIPIKDVDVDRKNKTISSFLKMVCVCVCVWKDKMILNFLKCVCKQLLLTFSQWLMYRTE